MTQYTTGDLQQVLDECGATYTPKQLRNLFDSGYVVGHRDGKGTGRFYFVSLMQMVSINYASRWLAAGFSWLPVVKAMDKIMNFSEEKLCAEFAQGRKYLVPDTKKKGLRMKLTSTEIDPLFDLQDAYNQTKEVLARVAKETAEERGRGRRRTLAAKVESTAKTKARKPAKKK